MHEKDGGAQAVAWDNVHITITPAGGGPAALDYSDDFEDGLEGWTARLFGPPPNDDPILFSSSDPLLYDNNGNPGSTSAGYSSDLAVLDNTPAAYLLQLFPAVVSPGTYMLTYEYDAYVYEYPVPNNDAPTVFDAAGTGIEGPNTGYPGSQAVGVTYDPADHDGTEYTWFEQLFPGAIPAGTYDITLDADVYVYKAGANVYELGSRILFLTDAEFDDDGIDPGGDVSPGFGKSTWNQESAGTWVHINQLYPDVLTTGDLEFRLVVRDKMQTAPGPVTIAWDNVSFTITEIDGGPEVFTLSDDFESGYGDWTYVKRGPDAYGVGNRMYVLTDAQYDDPTWDFDNGPRGDGFSVDYWPGIVDDVKTDWSATNGIWQHAVIERELTTNTGNIEVRLLLHDKSTGDQAVAWDNLTLTLTPPTPPCNNPRFDADGDTDVDQDDLGVFQICHTGLGGNYDFDNCRCMNSDGDQDVDSSDLAAFESCASGPGIDAPDEAETPPCGGFAAP
jgi:hypothetical protein